MDIELPFKVCGKCGGEFPRTEEFFYPARPTATHPKGGFQSNCKPCWKDVNKKNKERRKIMLS